MCGICGIYNFKTNKPVSYDLLKSMADTLVHRGPDDDGYYVSGSLGLGHRRLSIIDLEGGHQPISNEDDSIWVICNGEIYNFIDLRDELEKKGHTFKTGSDTEVILHLYEEYGEECISHLNGMYAIALWDDRKKKLLLTRDRVGKKPLFYYYDGSRFIFASEMKAILEVPDIIVDLDIEALSDYLSLLYIPAPKSIYRQIRKLMSAHYITVTEMGMRENEYWDLSFAETMEYNESEWCELILEEYSRAVGMRLISDVPLGAFLSGGVDSSSVVGMMSNKMNSPVITSSIGFEEKEFNEVAYANIIASRFRTEHYEEIVRPDALDVLAKLAWHYDEPFADSSAIPTYYVSKASRKRVTVALSGDGGDENFCGYRRYYFDKRENIMRSFLPQTLRSIIFGALATVYPKADWAPRIFRAKATFESLACSHVEGYFRSMSAFLPELKNKLLSPDVLSNLHGYDTMDIFSHYYNKADTDDKLSRIQYLDIKTYLTDDILVKVDRASMANSLEVRAPILDYKFMELVSRIPSSLKMKGTNGKYIFKKALEAFLPNEILYRTKMGFGVPLESWFKNELKDLSYSVIVEGRDDAIFRSATVRQIWEEHQNGRRNRSTELWILLMYGMWQQEFSK